MSEMNRSSFTVTSSTEIKWDTREKQESWVQAIGVVLVAFILVILFPYVIIIFTVVLTIGFFIFSSFINTREAIDAQSGWREHARVGFDLIEEEKYLRRSKGQKFSLIGMELKSVAPKLPGNMASLIRALPSSDGFSLSVTLVPGDTGKIIEDRNLTGMIETYLKTKSKSELETYMDFKAGLWISKVCYIGMVHDDTGVRFHEAAVKASVPSKGWRSLRPTDVMKRLTNYQGAHSSPSYYAVGQELSEWLIQLRSELANEVGTNVPGQFVVDIRSRPADLPLGVVLNPDTLQTGPTTGLSFDDITNGVLICGGSKNGRHNLIKLLTKSLLDSGKRVLIISARSEMLNIVALDDSGVGLTLGKDFILNPIDAESVHRNVFVPRLLRALETLADKSLTSAADLEVALGRAVALPNSTVADIKFETDSDGMSDDEILKTNVHPVKLSLWGLEGLRKLHEGSGARAFYGTQTSSMSTITSLPLSIIVTDLGDIPLDVFAVDLLMIKLSGLKPDKDLVIMIDDPDSLRTENSKYSRRSLWTDSLVRDLSKVASVVISIDQPYMLSPGVKNELSSCISLRLRDEKDIASVSSRLALSVIGTGLHSKARWSARESSFLRTMDDGVALIVHNEVETAQPIRLHELPELNTLSQEGMHSRIRTMLPPTTELPKRMSGSILTLKTEDNLPRKILKLIERYEPLTEEAIRRFILASGEDGDVEGILIRLKESSLILEGHESHSGVSYKNYRLTMKGNMALRQTDKEVATTS